MSKQIGIQIILPISKDNKHFPSSKYFFPKPLVEVKGEPMMTKIIKHYQSRLKISRLVAVIPEDWDLKYSIGKVIELATNAEVKTIKREGETTGGLCSAIMAVDELNDEDPIVVINSDELINANIQKIVSYFEEDQEKADAGLVLFESLHPRWCYAKLNRDQTIEGLYEKNVVSNLAMAGFIYIRKKSILMESACHALMDNDEHDGAYFLSAAINQIILRGGRVKQKQIKADDYCTFYTPEKIKIYEENYNDREYMEKEINIVIPAAGEGSRFKNKGWKVPKPFIDVGGKSMIERVIDNVDIETGNYLIVLRKEHLSAIDEQSSLLRDNRVQIIECEKLTSGTATTVMLACNQINNQAPLLIANSDQIVNTKCIEMHEKAEREDLDGVIMVFKEESKDPKWSYAKVNGSGLVTKVAEKKAISNLATSGIYYFRKGSHFVNGYSQMVLDEYQVNGEYYTCPIYNYLVRDGLKIGIYEIDKDEMHGLGTPNDLNRYLHLNKLDSKHKP